MNKALIVLLFFLNSQLSVLSSDLNGKWILKKRTIERVNPQIVKERTLISCNERLPFENRSFEKEVVISPYEEDVHLVRSIYPASDDIYFDPNVKTEIKYQNYNFKGVIIPEELTYSYTLKLFDHLEYPTLARQLLLMGRLFVENMLPGRITGKGYELISTPECSGFVRDEIEFELIKAS